MKLLHLPLLPAILSVSSMFMMAGEPTPKATLSEPERIIRKGDVLRLTLKVNNGSNTVLNKVEKNGEVATPDGSFIKADSLSLETFRTNFSNLYKGIQGYENSRIEVLISSSPYGVIKYPSSKSLALNATNLPPPTLYPRNFSTPKTVWTAIQDEGGIPQGVKPDKICILKQNLERKTLHCRPPDGGPDGATPIESGDYLFLVPESTPISQLFGQ